MGIYVKKPVRILAHCFGHEIAPMWFENAVNKDQTVVLYREINPEIGTEIQGYVKTLEGKMYFREGDYIIKGVEGELYPCKASIFEKTYDKITKPEIG